jgi:pyruvate dehydrogenase E1 component alpha subunit
VLTSLHAMASAQEMVRLLSPEGELVADPEFDAPVSGEQLRGWYRDMALVRRFDREGNALQRQGQLGMWVSLLGQEGAQIGAGRALRRTDTVFPSYREHGVAWCRGIEPAQLAGIFRGVEMSGWDPIAERFHTYTIVIGNQVLNATGYAMGQRLDGAVGSGAVGSGAVGSGAVGSGAVESGAVGSGAVGAREPGAAETPGGDDTEATIVFFGDGATSQGDVHEAMVFAAAFDAPVVFFCQNNQWAISAPVSRQSRVPLADRAKGYGFRGVRVDGNDVVACHAVTQWALQECRSGNGPVLIEAFTYRMDAHTTSDDPTRYRLAAETESWRLLDPIERVRALLVRSGQADAAFFAEVDAEGDAVAARFRAAVLAMTAPDPEAMFDHVYVGPNSQLAGQRAELHEYLTGFEDDPGGVGAGDVGVPRSGRRS